MSLPRAKMAATVFSLDPASVTAVATRENLTYCASDGAIRYALRLHRQGYASQAEIQSELAFMDALARSGLSVPRPRQSSHGALVERVEGQFTSALSWQPGQTLLQAQSDPDTDRPALFRTLGTTLARLHTAADAWTPPPSFTRKRWDADGLLGETPVWGRFWDNPHLSAKDQVTLRDLRARLAERLNSAAPNLDFGLIHADAVGDNVLVHDGQTTLIDFDDSGYGYRLFDLATPLNKLRGAPDYPDLETALLDGYRQHRPLDTTHYPLIALLRALTYLGWIIPRINEPGGRDRLLRFRTDAFALIDAP